MPVYKGSQNQKDIYYGGTKIGKIYKGSTLLYNGSNWGTLPIPNSSGASYCVIFNSDIHGLLVITNDIIYKTDLNTVSPLSNLPAGIAGYRDYYNYVGYIYYNNSNNKLLLLDKGSSTDPTKSFISTDKDLSLYNTGTLPSDPYYNYAYIRGHLNYGNGYYVIGGEYYPNTTEVPNQTSLPVIFYSTDGINWNRSVINGSVVNRQGGSVKQIGFGNNRFVALGDDFVNGEFNGTAISVSNPNNWSNRTAIDYSCHIRNKIIFCNGYFYHFTWGDEIIRSSDGITWVELNKPLPSSGYHPDNYNFNIYYKDNLYYITDEEDYIYSTSDFITYKKYEGANVKSGWTDRIGYALYGNYFVVSDGLNIYYSLISELKEV